MREFVVKHQKIIIVLGIVLAIILSILFYRNYVLGSLDIKTDPSSRVVLYNEKNIKIFESTGSVTKKLNKGQYNLRVEFEDGEIYSSPVFVYSGKKTLENVTKPKTNHLEPVASVHSSVFKVWPNNNSIDYIDKSRDLLSLAGDKRTRLISDVVDAVFISPGSGYAIKSDDTLIRFSGPNVFAFQIKVNNIAEYSNQVYAWNNNQLYKINGSSSDLIWQKEDKVITSFVESKNKTYLAYIDEDQKSEVQTIEITNKEDGKKVESKYTFSNTSEETNQDQEEAKYIRYYFGSPSSEYLVIQEGPISYVVDEDLNTMSKLDLEYDLNFTWLDNKIYYSSSDKLYEHNLSNGSNILLAQTYSNKNIRQINASENSIYLSFSNSKDELGIYKYSETNINNKDILNYLPYFKDGCDLYYININKPQILFINDYSKINKGVCGTKIFNNLLLNGINNKKVEEIKENSK